MKFLGILVLGLLLSNFGFNNSAHAKVSMISQTDEYVIFKWKRGVLNMSDRKWAQVSNQVMSSGNNHCSRYNKDAYWFRGLSRGSENFDAGIDLMDTDDRAFGHAKYRVICANNTNEALTIFKRGAPGYISELSARPSSHYLNSFNKEITLKSSDFNNTDTATSSSSSSSSSSSTGDKIAQAKQICKDLGFKTKTEKFADCSLQMLSMQFEVQNRETLSGGGTQQKIVVNQGYSVGDAMIALSGIISDANNVRSSYGGGNCRIFQHAYHASLKCN